MLKEINNQKRKEDQRYSKQEQITLKFNIPKPHDGERGQFERLIGLTKQRLYKSTGRCQLAYNELEEEILLDVKTNLNNSS